MSEEVVERKQKVSRALCSAKSLSVLFAFLKDVKYVYISFNEKGNNLICVCSTFQDTEYYLQYGT